MLRHIFSGLNVKQNPDMGATGVAQIERIYYSLKDGICHTNALADHSRNKDDIIEAILEPIMKKILYVDMDNVLVDFPSAFPQVPNDILKKYANNKDDIPGIFSLMQPYDGAIDAYEKLSQKYDTYILSTAPWDNPSAWSDKIIWVKKYFGSAAYKRLILSHHKDLNLGDYLIDDRKKNGAEKFKGEHIHFGKEPFPDWQSVLSYLF